MTITGVDLLFVVVGFVLLFLLVEVSDRYSNWTEWDRDRRRQRKLDRLKLLEEISERDYRRHLRFIFHMKLINVSTNKFIVAMKDLGNRFKEFNQILGEK